MRTHPAIFFLVATLIPACTSTSVTGPGWNLKRTSFLQKVGIPEVTISTNGTATLKGYTNDGGQEAAAKIAAAAIAATLKAAAP